MSDDRIRIAPRFNGPPDSGNGGYVAGRLAAFLDAPSVRVRLSAPPPLETELTIRRDGGAVELVSGERTFARAIATDLQLARPTPPSFDEAVRASRRYRGFDEHVFPTCFVFGPARSEGDGLRLFPGALEDRDTFACPWCPDASLGDGSGRVAPEFLWAALDCPGGFSFPQPESGAMLLGEIEVRLAGSVDVGEACVLTAWAIEHVGRKHRTGTALHGADGRCVGVSLATWIELAKTPG